MEQIADGVTFLNLKFSNVYLIRSEGDSWVIVDSGFTGKFEEIRNAAETLFGRNSRPEAILLTHAHPDHYGSALALAAFWNVPIYAHPLDLPYLSGRSMVPPSDPTVGGVFSFISRFLPPAGTDLGDYLKALPEDHSVPGLPDWEWIPTPGHMPGQVSFFRKSDATLIAGDAVLTIDLDKLSGFVDPEPRLARPSSPTTYDWLAVRHSLQRLAALKPYIIASGHGTPLQGADVAERLQDFANDFMPPLHGRYVAEPATMDENGIVYLPPPASDPLPKVAIAIGIALFVTLGVQWMRRGKQNESKS